MNLIGYRTMVALLLTLAALLMWGASHWQTIHLPGQRELQQRCAAVKDAQAWDREVCAQQ